MEISFPDGRKVEYSDGTTGYEIAKSISEGLARNALGIFVNEKKYDLHRPLYESGEARIVTFNDEEGKEIFWHSSAHLMAEAIETLYPGAKFGVGPAIENGFYYDVALPDGKTISLDDLPAIEKKMIELSRKKSEYERVEMDWSEAVDYFKKKGDQYKVELLEDLKDDAITFYKQGDFVDLCRGTHLPNTGSIKAVKLLSVAGAYWRGDADRDMMTRVYGVSFPKKKALDEHLAMLEEAKKRDHRKLGRDLELFLVAQDIGVGLVNWLPNGTIVRRIIEDFVRKEHIKRGYDEVITPVLANLNLFRTSGHYPYYKESQYPPIELENEKYLLKPMNCPHHHILYASKTRSFRDLPMRLFEFGNVHRYEQSGELSGMSRVRYFTQDDAHIYCVPDQLKDEVKGVVDFIQYLYKAFELKFTAELSFRDEDDDKFAGDPEKWDRAQREITEAADEIGLEYKIVKGEAAFYGPKIDFIARDAIGRRWQLGTCQVDYLMPERFELEYVGSDNAPHRPVIIHRAPLGSYERFMSILIEHYAGNFPFWLAPVQATVLPIGPAQHEFAKDVERKLKALGYRVKIDLRGEKINRKIAESEHMKIPYALVIGQKEADNNTAALREHGVGDLGEKLVDEIIELFASQNKPPVE